MKTHHRVGSLTHRRTRLTRRRNFLRRKVLRGDQWHDGLDEALWDVLLVIVNQPLHEQVWVVKKLLTGGGPVIGFLLLHRTGGTVGGFYLKQDTNPLYGHHHPRRRCLIPGHLRDLGGLEIL